MNYSTFKLEILSRAMDLDTMHLCGPGYNIRDFTQMGSIKNSTCIGDII